MTYVLQWLTHLKERFRHDGRPLEQYAEALLHRKTLGHVEKMAITPKRE